MTKINEATDKPVEIGIKNDKVPWDGARIERWHKEFKLSFIRRLERHYELHRRPLAYRDCAQLYAGTCAKMGMKVITYLDTNPEDFFICQAIDNKIHIFARSTWNALPAEEQQRWLNAEF